MMMNVTTDDDDAQAVLLDSMDGTQYITIQRSETDELGKNVPLLTLNSDLISEGMVVDMINAGVATEYPTTQYYETDLLDHELNEEDRKLAAALVAVQLQQQQKNQQQSLHNHHHQQHHHHHHHHHQTQHDVTSLPDVSQLATLSPVNAYSIQTIANDSVVGGPQSSSSSSASSTAPGSAGTQSPSSQSSATTIYPQLQQQQTFKRIINHHNVKQEFISVKSEYDIDVSADSSEDATILCSTGQKRSLPHKKRIARKLKQQTKKNHTSNVMNKRDNSNNNNHQEIIPLDIVNESHQGQQHLFKCELCGNKFVGQLKFFEHLKTHYEPVKQETRIAQATNTNISISVAETVQGLENGVIEEFSEPEDIMEGIRGVVEETGAHIDEDTETTPLSDINSTATLWTIANVTQSVTHSEHNNESTTTINEHNLNNQDKYETGIIENTKKKKCQKPRKTPNDEMTCPQCDRSFHHKNSLVYHMRSHSGERPHQCEVCGKSFFAASALKVHKRLHSGDKPYKCEDCGRHFRQWGDLKYHSMSIHSEQRQFQCEYCGKDFARKYSLIVHRRIHTGEKNYRCEYCNKTFRASSYLQNHRRIHTGEKPHPCTVCGKPFRVRSDMKRHMHTHTRGRNDRPINNRIVNGKTINHDDKNIGDESGNSDINNVHTRTLIQDLVQELKLESPNSVVEIVAPVDDNPESILPHEGGQQLEFNVSNDNDGNNDDDRDPLAAVDRTADTLQYFFM
ncbi:hypothetical protein PV327_010752 [Microctonus hyperodae]|uniref:C2H2-type domain-containing protein n=1 Tax=Microctonus hyperodae TaxID=165561 RepID=A0AA39EZ30_MICHY|nr:hypothetical protein PV327_010752 [Microctonus hyperodae]